MKKTFILVLFSILAVTCAMAQQVSERLNRGAVAVKASNGVLVSWRSLATDDAALSFNVYRDGTKITSSPITSKTNYLDTAGKPGFKYTVEAVLNGNVVETAEAVAWQNMFTSLKVNRPAAQAAANGSKGYYFPGDMSVGDVDGDGEYELILKWMPDNQQDNGYNGYTSPCIIDCYEMDGTQLWRINLGLNIRSGNHYTQFLVYDFDGDGKAEMICKTAPGSLDGKGKYVSEAATDARITDIDNTKTYVNSNGRISGGGEFLTVFDGQTGAAKHTIWYSPSRACVSFPTAAGDYSGNWGDSNYNRGNRYNAAVAYLDGNDKLPSAIMQRGYYTRCYVWAVDWDGKELKTRWLHAGITSSMWYTYDAAGTQVAKSTNSKSSYGQGVHGISVGDVNCDGHDDICIGAATIDHEGKLLCTTGKGHGDAIHLADLVPSRPGLEVMMPHEESPYGYDVHDATTGQFLTQATSGEDNGRGLACDFIPSNPGSEFWSSADNNIRSCADGTVVASSKPDTNFRIYWTGDPYDQTFDGRYDKTSNKCAPRIRYWNTSSSSIKDFITFTSQGGPQSCNTTKATPCLQADLFGDWREEIVMYQYEDNKLAETFTLMIFSTPEPTPYKVPCLMQDHVYRMGVAWQNSSYNQPPHLGYSLADYLKIDGAKYANVSTSSHAPSYTDPNTEINTDPSDEMSEMVAVPDADKALVTGICYVAGVNGEFTNSTKGEFIKTRTNLNSSIEFKVNEGYIITGVKIEGYSNNTSTIADRSIDLIGAYIDGSETNIVTTSVKFPGGTAGQAPVTADVKGFEAKQTIRLAFDNSRITTSDVDGAGKNAQLYASFTFTYKKATGDGIFEVKSEELRVKNLNYYNLNGQRVNGNAHGIVIKNGKKYVK